MIAPWVRDHEILRREVRRPIYMPLLGDLHQTAPGTVDLLDWPAVARFVAQRGIRTAHADCVLRPLARELSIARDARLSTVVLLLFMPSLVRLQRAKREWVPDRNERWGLICWCFLHALRRLDPFRRAERLGQKLLNDTARRLYDECAREWKDAARLVVASGDDLDLLTGGVDDPDFEAVDLRETRDAAMRRICAAAAAGLISATDADLLLGTRIYGATLTDVADRMGVPHERLKKQRQRAEKKLARAGQNVVPVHRVDPPSHCCGPCTTRREPC